MTRKRPGADIATLHLPFRVLKRGGRKERKLADETESGLTAITDLKKRDGIAPRPLQRAAGGWCGIPATGLDISPWGRSDWR